jgi:hypothetical protein
MEKPMVPNARTARPHAATINRTLAGLGLGIVLALGSVVPTQAQSRTAHGSEDAYALVRDGEQGSGMTGRGGDWQDLQRIRKQVGGEFLWFRDDGKSYVIQDRDTLARARAAWEPVERLGRQMEALGQEMNGHGKAMDALGKEMNVAARDMRVDEGKVRDIQRRMDAVGQEMGKVGQRMGRADDAEQARLDARMAELGRQMDRLGNEMGAATHTDAQRGAERAMRDVGLRMDEAGKPMDALGKKMDALGKQMDVESERADKAVRGVIRDAMAKGLARPAPQG